MSRLFDNEMERRLMSGESAAYWSEEGKAFRAARQQSNADGRIGEGKMDKEIKKRWVEALRSGKYEQGYDQLRDGDKFCCLGVLCEVLKVDYTPTASGLPLAAREKANVIFSPLVVLHDRPTALSNLNDGDAYHKGAWDFNQIADIIEAQL